jgi:hypothetical protein
MNTPASGPWASWVRFWFAPADPIALHALRVLSGLLFLGWLLPLAGHYEALFGLAGWFDAQAYQEAARIPGASPSMFSWSVFYLCGTDPLRLAAAYWLSVGVLVLFTVGLWPRVTATLTWVVVVSCTANPVLSYDADPLLVLLSFYLMVGYLLQGQWTPGQSWLSRLLGTKDALLWRPGPRPVATPSAGANFAVRLLQVHFAVAVVASGLHKLQIREWWAGVAPWYYLTAPLTTTPDDVRSYMPNANSLFITLSLGAYLALAWQIAFPAFAWRRGWRPVLLLGAALAWVFDLAVLGLPLFGPITVIGCLSYLAPDEWRRAGRLLGRLWPKTPEPTRTIGVPPATGRGVKGKPSNVPVGSR